MFSWLRWQLAKRRLRPAIWGPLPAQIKCGLQLHRVRAEDLRPNAERYSRLAVCWDDYVSWRVPQYDRFLAAAVEYYGQSIESVLDLACGTGAMSRPLAARFSSVVGLDASEAMIREARARGQGSGVQFVLGDFRDFCLNETFDAVICGGDSLNYLDTPAELTDVFRCVRQHLRPGGLFVFDVVDQAILQGLAHLKAVGMVGGEPFEIYYFYDPITRISEDRVVFRDAVEWHRRIPIEKRDVKEAAARADLLLVDHFAHNAYLPVSPPAKLQFYVLRAPLP